MESQTSTLTRPTCDECSGPVHYIDFDFIKNAQRVMPCGHNAPITFKPEEG